MKWFKKKDRGEREEPTVRSPSPTELDPEQVDSVTTEPRRVTTPHDSVYAFFVRAEEHIAQNIIDTTGPEKWENTIRTATKMPKARVHMIQEADWEAPKLHSLDEGLDACIEGIQKYFTAHHLPPMSRSDFVRAHLGDMKNPLTGLLVVLVRHSSSGRLPLP